MVKCNKTYRYKWVYIGTLQFKIEIIQFFVVLEKRLIDFSLPFLIDIRYCLQNENKLNRNKMETICSSICDINSNRFRYADARIWLHRGFFHYRIEYRINSTFTCRCVDLSTRLLAILLAILSTRIRAAARRIRIVFLPFKYYRWDVIDFHCV